MGTLTSDKAQGNVHVWFIHDLQQAVGMRRTRTPDPATQEPLTRFGESRFAGSWMSHIYWKAYSPAKSCKDWQIGGLVAANGRKNGRLRKTRPQNQVCALGPGRSSLASEPSPGGDALRETVEQGTGTWSKARRLEVLKLTQIRFDHREFAQAQQL